MKLVSVTCFRNEADVLESFVRYHLQIFDKMILVNHWSVDDSVAVLHALIAEGLNLELRDELQRDFQLAAFQTQNCRAAVEADGADIVMPLDADEFLTTRDGSPVRPHLEAMASDRVTKVPWRTHVPHPTVDFEERSILERLPFRRTDEGQQFFKIVLPRAMVHRGGEVGAGSHTFLRPGALMGTELPYSEHPVLQLAHFPVRSPTQIRAKVLVGWPVILAKANRQRNESVHMKALFDRVAGGERFDTATLADMAVRYSNTARLPALTLDPVRTFVAPVAPRLAASRCAEPERVLMLLAEEQAAALAESRQRLLDTTDPIASLRARLSRSRLSTLVLRLGRARHRVREALRGKTPPRR